MPQQYQGEVIGLIPRKPLRRSMQNVSPKLRPNIIPPLLVVQQIFPYHQNQMIRLRPINKLLVSLFFLMIPSNSSLQVPSAGSVSAHVYIQGKFFACHHRSNCTQIQLVRFPQHQINHLMDILSKNAWTPIPVDQLHISLSKTLFIPKFQIHTLIGSLKDVSSRFASFPIRIAGFAIYENESKTRTFLAIEVFRGHHDLTRLINAVNQSLADLRLPRFYEEPSFHVSIAWSEQKLEIPVFGGEDELSHLMSQVSCRIGQKHYTFDMMKL
jgi:2'-5' RNA ligase